MADGKLTFLPNTSWWGLNSLTLMEEFLALRGQARAVSHWQLISSLTFKRTSVKIASCHSHIPLHHGDSAGVVDIFILKFSQKSEKSSETNYPPLSLDTFDAMPKIFIQFWRKFLIIIVGLLPLMMVALLNQVKSSIMWKYQIFLTRLWKSIATVWLNAVALGNPTTGLGGCFLMGFAYYTIITNFTDKLWNFCRKESCIF